MIARACLLVPLAACLSTPSPPACQPAHALSGLDTGTMIEIVPYLSKDRLELYFSSDRDGFYTIYRATRTTTTGSFETVTALVPPDSHAGTFDPILSEDGSTLWYVQGDGDSGGSVYEATRDGSERGFGGDHIVFDKLGQILHPSLTADQLTIYFDVAQPVSPAGTTYHDIWTATRGSTSDAFGAATPLPFNTTDYDEYAPAISPDGETLLYTTSYVPDFAGQRIMRATRRTGFADSAVLDGIGQAIGEDDRTGAFHADGRTIVFTTSRDGGAQRAWITCE